MKKTLVALSISAALTLPVLAFENPVNSTTTTNNKSQVTIDEVVLVTAGRSTQYKFDVLASVEVFDRDAIEQIQPSSLADLLSRVAGITIAPSGSRANQTSLFVRGTNSDHVLVLVNGVRVGSATLGTKELSTIQMELVERVEVVKGPRAALWGSDAIGGVIQIFTRQFDAGEGQVGIKVGSHNYWQGYGAFGFGNEQHNYTVSTSAETSDGYDVLVPDPANLYPVDQPDNDGYNREAIALNGTSHFNDVLSLEINGQYEQGSTQYDANPFYTGDETDYKNHNLLARTHFQLENSYYQIGVATSKDSNEDNYASISPGADNIFFETKRNQVNALGKISLAEQSEVVFGVDWYNEEVTSSTVYSTKKRDAHAVYVTARHSVSALKLEAALRNDKVGDNDAELTYQLGAGYQLSPKLLIALTQGTAFKAPSFNELYWPADAYFTGNADLKPETSQSTELITRYQDDDFGFELSLYQTKFENLIENGPVDDNNPWGLWSPKNIAEATIKGVEATANVNIAGTSNVLTLSHIDAQDDTTEEQLLRRPYFTANYTINYYGNDWDMGLNINYQGSRYDNFSFQRVKMPSYTLVTLNARYEVTSRLSVKAQVTNLADKEYQQMPERPGDERGYNLSVHYRF